MKRILSFTLALIMALTVLPMSAFATEVTVTDESLPAVIDPASTEAPAEVEVHYQTVTHANPLYFSEPVITSVTEYHYSTQYLANFNFNFDDYHSEADVIEEITEHLHNRETAFTVYVKVDAFYDTISTDLFYAAIEHTGAADEGDYIKYQYGRFDAGTSYAISGYTYVQIDYIISYYADAAQEATVDNKVATVLAALNVNGMSDYEKIKAIYDYICLNVVYDYDNLNDPTYLLKHSAYAALINGKAVCQGYALLFYRLALELGIDCRIVTGQSEGQNHAWNIVKLNGKYYNVDSTWDAEYFDKRGVYNYFLKSDADFDEHIRDAEHSSESFYAAYPMHTESYDVNLAVIDAGTCGAQGDNLTWSLSGDGILTIDGNGDMFEYGWFFDENDEMYRVDPPWLKYFERIKQINIGVGVEYIVPWTLVNCTSLENVFVDDANTSLCDINGVLYDTQLTTLFVYPEKSAITDYVMPETISWFEIGIQADNLKTITLPGNLESVQFWYCPNLETVTVNSLFTEIYELDQSVTIRGYEDSVAKEYALANGNTFVSLGEIPRAVIDSGNCGDNLTWEFDNRGTLTISGEGPTYDYGFGDDNSVLLTPWFTFKDSIKEIVLDEGITSIDDYFLYSLVFDGEYVYMYPIPYVTSIVIPASVTEIGFDALCGLTSLEEIHVASGNEKFVSINGVLYSSDFTELVSYPINHSAENYSVIEGVTSVANIQANNLKTIVLPESLLNVGNIKGQNLEKITCYSTRALFRNSAYTLESQAVLEGYDNSPLQDYAEAFDRTFVSMGSAPVKVVATGKCGDNLTWELTNYGILNISGTGDMYDDDSSIPWGDYCDSIKEVNFPAGITYIHLYYLAGCNNMKCINVDEANTAYCDVDGILYNKDLTTLVCYPYKSEITDLVLPDTLTSFTIFLKALNLKNITCPNGLKSIGIWNSPNLETVKFLSLNTAIHEMPEQAILSGYEGSSAQEFAWNNNYEFVSLGQLPESVIASGVCGENLTWELTNYGTLTISGTGPSYDYGWVGEVIVETPWLDYVEQIEEIVLNEGITYIDGEMLYGIVDNGDHSYSARYIPNVTTINIPASVIDIDSYAFDGLYNLTEITVDEDNEHFISLDGVLYSADMTDLLAYPGEYSATTYEIPEGVQYMFTEISNTHLDELVLPESLIRASMISGMMTKVTFKSMDTYINEWPGAIAETAIIYGYEGSTAQDYAEKYNRTFVSMGQLPERVIESGTCGDNVTWELTNYGVLTIDGTGDMYQYGYYYDENEQQVFRATPWESYADDIIKINIGAGITYVCEYSVDVYSLEEFNVDEANTEYCDVDGVLYNKAVTYMIAYPFCYSASEFVAPETVEHINYIGSYNLRKVILPESVDQVNYIFGDYIERIEFHSADIHFYDIYVGDACVIYGCEGSFAQEFAEENGLTFKSLEELESSGDINGDENVDKNDAIYLLYSVLFGESSYPLNQECDFNGDGSTDKNDAIYLLYHALFGAESYPLN